MSFIPKGCVPGALISSDFFQYSWSTLWDRRKATCLHSVWTQPPTRVELTPRRHQKDLEPQCFQKPTWRLSFTLNLSSEIHTEQFYFFTSMEKADSQRDPFLSVTNNCRPIEVGLHLVECSHCILYVKRLWAQFWCAVVRWHSSIYTSRRSGPMSLSWFVLLPAELSELAFIQRVESLKLSEAGVNVIINSTSDTWLQLGF